MGWVLSKFRRKRSTFEELEKIETELSSLGKLKTETLVWQKKVLGHLVTYSILLYLISALVVYFRFLPGARGRQDQAILLLPFLVTPLLIYILRRLLTWWYHRKVARGDTKLAALRDKKAKILEEVMEKETYKVAKQILDKFAPGKTQGTTPPRAPSQAPPRPSSGGPGSGMEVRRRPVTGGLNSTAPNGGATTTPSQGPPGSVMPRPGGALTPGMGRGGGPAMLGGPPPPMLGPPGVRGGAPGPPLPRPVLPRERGYLDKFVEYLVGDGPANRFALVCRQCQSHNGMALREEFEYIAYRCCYCFYWNPARKQRPVAPRLPDPASQRVRTDSSSSDQSESGQSSAPQSRRGSLESELPDRVEEVEILEREPEAGKEETEEGAAVVTEVVGEKEETEEAVVTGEGEEDVREADEVFVERSDIAQLDTESIAAKDSIGGDWGLVINQEEVREESLEDEEAMEVEVEGSKVEIKGDQAGIEKKPETAGDVD